MDPTKTKEKCTTRINKEEEEKETDVGQGKLYSPAYATQKTEQKKQSINNNKGGEMGVVEEIKKHLGGIKERVLDKLAAASVPAEALENARHFLESVVRDVSMVAHGLTMDALTRIKTHLVDIIPSLSPTITRKMVDEAAREANREGERKGEEEEEGEGEEKQSQTSSKVPYASPASSFFASLKPFSKL